MTHKQLRKAIKYKWDRIQQWEIDECILGSLDQPLKKKGSYGLKGKDCHIQKRGYMCLERNGLSTKY